MFGILIFFSPNSPRSSPTAAPISPQRLHPFPFSRMYLSPLTHVLHLPHSIAHSLSLALSHVYITLPLLTCAIAHTHSSTTKPLRAPLQLRPRTPFMVLSSLRRSRSPLYTPWSSWGPQQWPLKSPAHSPHQRVPLGRLLLLHASL